MKTTIDIIQTLPEDHVIRYYENTYKTVSELIFEAQKDAWNSALDWVVNNANIDWQNIDYIKLTIDKDLILQGKL